MSLWDSLFEQLRQPIAQILLTRNDIADRSHYQNAVSTIHALLEMEVIPIVNENDTLAVSEIRFGDNDTLSAITAAMVHADYLFLMTDVDCLYDSNPRTNPNAKAIEVVDDIDALRVDVSSKGSSLGTGGMSTKIVAARLAASAGVTTIIAKSTNPKNIFSIVQYIQSLGFPRNKSLGNLNLAGLALSSGSSTPNLTISEDGVTLADTPNETASNEPILKPLHTRFTPNKYPIRDRRFWLLHGLAPHGTIYIDTGAEAALTSKAGLLPVGVLDVSGEFSSQEAVRLCVVEKLPKSDPYSEGKRWTGIPREIGRALVSYSSKEIEQIRGLQSREIHRVLGYSDTEYVALRDNISLDVKPSRPVSPTAEHSVLDI